MIKLNGQSLAHGAQIAPESFALNLMERTSTATIALGPNEPEVVVNDWLLDDEDPGAGIVWRVKTVDDTFNTNTRAVTLEHVINTLRDVSMFGEHKTGTIAGNESAKNCTARQAAEYALSFQSIWTLGVFEYDMSAPFAFNGDDVFSAMEKISSALDDPWWDYDLTSLPFRLNIRRKSMEKKCEMRMGRNISTMRKTVDRSQMYTRIYPIGKKNMHIEGDYLSKNEGVWGRKDKVETDQSQETEEALRLWAQDRLNRHCDPLVTITICGLELSKATGESLDHLVLGTVCQVPLPEYRTTITERITKLAWRDKIKEQESVTVTLCNVRQDLASIISQQAAGGGGGARAAAKEAEEDHAWFVDTESHVAMVAEAIIGRGPEGVDWSRVAEIIVDGEGIHDQVVFAMGSLVTAFGRMDMTDQSVTAVFQRTGIDGVGESETLLSKIIQTAESLTTKVSKGEIASTINQTAQSVLIQASKINLDGYVTASQLDAANAKIDNLTSGITKAATLKASYIYGDQVFYNGNTLGGAIRSASASGSGGEITIVFTKYNGDTLSVNFSIADTQYYQDSVSASYKQGWNECRSAATSETCVRNYTAWNNGNSTRLYKNDTGQAFEVATGSAQVWRYGGQVVTRYILPAAKE